MTTIAAKNSVIHLDLTGFILEGSLFRHGTSEAGDGRSVDARYVGGEGGRDSVWCVARRVLRNQVFRRRGQTHRGERILLERYLISPSSVAIAAENQFDL